MKNSMNPSSCDLWCPNKRRNLTWGAPGAIRPSFEAKLLDGSICGLDYSREPGTSARHDETGPVSHSVSHGICQVCWSQIYPGAGGREPSERT